jgi:hypothetical protein
MCKVIARFLHPLHPAHLGARRFACARAASPLYLESSSTPGTMLELNVVEEST